MATNLTQTPPRRSAPFDQEPGFYEAARLWLYGNVRLLDTCLAHVPDALGAPETVNLSRVEHDTEQLVLSGKVLVTGVHNLAHQRAAVVALRWGAPRVLVLSGGFYHHIGEDLKQEPFPAARLWRYQFDAKVDLVISRRAPDKKPTFALHNPTVDRLIERIVYRQVEGVLFAGPI